VLAGAPIGFTPGAAIAGTVIGFALGAALAGVAAIGFTLGAALAGAIGENPGFAAEGSTTPGPPVGPAAGDTGAAGDLAAGCAPGAAAELVAGLLVCPPGLSKASSIGFGADDVNAFAFSTAAVPDDVAGAANKADGSVGSG